KVLALRAKTLGAARRPLARRPGHIPSRQDVEVQMVHALASLLFPRRKPPGAPVHFICSGGVNPPGIKVLALRAKTLGAARRPLARRPGHIPSRQDVE